MQRLRLVMSRSAPRGARAIGMAAAVCCALCSASAAGQAEPAGAVGNETVSGRALLLPTLVRPYKDGPLRVPSRRDGRARRLARRVDATLNDAVQDFDLTLDMSGERDLALADDDALVRAAEGRWVFSPRIIREGSKYRLRLVAVAPGSKVLRIRSEYLPRRRVEIRTMVLTRDLIRSGDASPRPPGPGDSVGGALPQPRARSDGRAILALNAAILGGYVGLSLQRSSGSDDARLTYPLVALGAGIGLGASMLVTEEWDIGLGSAWFLSASALWPTAAGLFLAEGFDVQPTEDRFVFGLVGAASGVALGTLALTFGPISTGGAVTAHSGGAFGMLLGGITDLAVRGEPDANASRGAGIGAAVGVVGAGILAAKVDVDSSRVLLIDLGASLGALSGAAIASPLVVGDETTTGKNRAWLASIAAGTLIGGGIAYLTTGSSTPPRTETGQRVSWSPYAGPIANANANAESSIAYGAGVHGSF